jgi:hypothetical protein
MSEPSKASDIEKYIYSGDGNKAKVEAIGYFKILLNTRFYLDLYKIFVVLSFRWNLISISSLDKNGFSYKFENRNFSLFLESKLVGFGKIFDFDKLYVLNNIASYNGFLHTSTQNVK